MLLDNFALGTPQAVAHLERCQGQAGARDILRINEFTVRAGADGVFAIAGFLALPLSQDRRWGWRSCRRQVNTFEACHAGVNKVVFSSIAAYGEPGDRLIDESANSLPTSPMLYSCTKLIGEALCNSIRQRRSMVACYATVYGERQHYRRVNALHHRATTASCAASRRSCPATAAVHDYIHVADVARANVMAMASEVTGEVFNVVTGVETTVKRIAEIVLGITGSDRGLPTMPMR
jgi:UDP-glucose 4-epimerase